MRLALFLLQTALTWQLAVGFFSEDFRNWLDKHHGKKAREWIERADLGENGSFGGQDTNRRRTHNPVVFIHGVANVAGAMMRGAAFYYLEHGYHMGEMYATTYDSPQGDQTKWMKYTMKCEHVKRMRFLIEAVHQYTKRKVDIVSFSMGVVIARKAILGGKCVDAKDDLGHSITDKIGTFIGVAGPNQGVSPVIGGIGYSMCALNPLIPVCNPTDGLFSGFCPAKSKFLEDINSKKGYEGRRVYTMGSTQDEVVGHHICNEVTTRIKGQIGEKIFYDKKHDDIFHKSYEIQMQMLRGQKF